MQGEAKGALLIIGGNEDKEGDCLILRRFVELAGGREARLVVMTTATELPREVGEEYRRVFSRLGAAAVEVLHMDQRDAAAERQKAALIEAASGVFFTGGDQLRLTSILGGTALDEAIYAGFRRGLVVAGTSAGASVMSQTMIVEGDSSDTPKKASMNMAQGMGLLPQVVIDQHFAQRGRINRLLEVVAQNPHVLGIGVDEDTALLVEPDGKCRVVGSQAVTIVDGKHIAHTNISESRRFDPLAITNVILHILPSGFGYDLAGRSPYIVNN